MTVRTVAQLGWRKILWRLCAVLIAGLPAILPVGCAAPRIDGSSSQTAVSSIRAVRKTVRATDRDRFDKDLTCLLSDGGRVTPLLDDVAARRRIDSKTADDVFRAATALRSEIARQEHDAKVKRELSAIHESFGRIDAKDSAVKLTLSKRPQIADLLEPEARTSSDRQIAALCGRIPAEDEFARQDCEGRELNAKGKLTIAIPSSIPTEIANRLRLTCAQLQPESYRARLACVSNGARIIPFAMKNPAVLDNLPPEERVPLEKIIGRQ